MFRTFHELLTALPPSYIAQPKTLPELRDIALETGAQIWDIFDDAVCTGRI